MRPRLAICSLLIALSLASSACESERVRQCKASLPGLEASAQKLSEVTSKLEGDGSAAESSAQAVAEAADELTTRIAAAQMKAPELAPRADEILRRSKDISKGAQALVTLEKQASAALAKLPTVDGLTEAEATNAAGEALAVACAKKLGDCKRLLEMMAATPDAFTKDDAPNELERMATEMAAVPLSDKQVKAAVDEMAKHLRLEAAALRSLHDTTKSLERIVTETRTATTGVKTGVAELRAVVTQLHADCAL